MLTRFLNALRGRPTDGDADASDEDGGGADVARASRAAPADAAAARRAAAPPARDTATFPALPPEAPLAHPSEMVDVFRQQVARTALALREQHPEPADAGARAARAHAERMLAKIAVDLDMVVRQPPPAAREALAVAGDPECELPALLRVIERDPAVTRGLMRHASSVMFAHAGPPASLDDAVRRLGARGVQVAVLAGMAEGLLHDSGPYLQDAELVWAHMVRVGPLARGLARGFDVPSHEAFLLGLLHDVGKLVLFDLLSAVRRDLRREVALPERLAADALRDLHEPLGGLALLRWGVDPRAAWAVAHHHRRDPSVEPGRRSELLYVAERLDAARVRRRPVDAERWAAEGRLTVPVARVLAAVERT
jgi:HD-like signal output (HDOD) protein